MLGIKISNSPSPSNLFNYETHHVMLSIYNLFNNKSEKQLIELLEEANTWHPNIRFDYKIGKSLPLLDVLLTNDNGILSTSVYHKSPSERVLYHLYPIILDMYLETLYKRHWLGRSDIHPTSMHSITNDFRTNSHCCITGRCQSSQIKDMLISDQTIYIS